jgi:hypothetical protein
MAFALATTAAEAKRAAEATARRGFKDVPIAGAVRRPTALTGQTTIGMVSPIATTGIANPLSLAGEEAADVRRYCSPRSPVLTAMEMEGSPARNWPMWDVPSIAPAVAHSWAPIPPMGPVVSLAAEEASAGMEIVMLKQKTPSPVQEIAVVVFRDPVNQMKIVLCLPSVSYPLQKPKGSVSIVVSPQGVPALRA